MDKSYRKIDLPEIKQIMLSILVDFDEFCKKHDLTMWLYAGTLLGAVRHKGYIPWDDDIDVCMSRKDYNKLISMADKIDPKYELFEHSLNKKYRYPFAKLSLKNTSCVEFHNPKFCGVKLGLYIDIFPIDFVGNTMEESLEFCTKNNELVQKSLCYLNFPLEGNIFKKAYQLAKKVILHNGCRANKFLKQFDQRVQVYKEPTKYSAMTAWGFRSDKTILESEEYKGNVKVTFEGKTFNVFNGYIHYLEVLFGDYMKLPPVEQREVHGFDAYIKDEITKN